MDALVERGRQDHPTLKFPSPDKQELSHCPSPVAPVKGRVQQFYDCDLDMETTVAMALCNTLSQAGLDDQETDDYQTPLLVVCSVLGMPMPKETPSPLSVWRALGLEPMTGTYLHSEDKEALSPTSQPLYLRTHTLLDPEPQESVEGCLFADSDSCSTDASDTCRSRRKRTKLRNRGSTLDSPHGVQSAFFNSQRASLFRHQC